MQPLRLHVHGLHSFRSPVDVDFGWLGQHGLFGIFGPVGSGKSTLLDAMTLALYGQVDRLAGRSKRGIVNHQAGRCEVRLRFRVGDVEWEAHRSYRADAEGVAQRVHSRLARANGARLEVVADKERDVNAAIEDLLGLSAADFMRAVVLPQGRFMQFLHLQGADRRKMLQRLFKLEAYGEDLRARVKLEADRVEGALRHAVGELEGLGPAGPIAVAEAQAQSQRAEAEAERARQVHQLAVTALAAARASRAHHDELRVARDELDVHLRSEAGVRDLRERIEHARRVRPALRTWRSHLEAVAARDRAQQDAIDARSALAAASLRERELSALAESHRQARVANGPDLESRRQALRGAIRMVGDLEDAASRAHTLSLRRGQLRRRQDDDERALAALELQLEDVVARRTAIRAAWSETWVAPAEREQVRRAEAARAALEAARRQADGTRAAAEHARVRAEQADEAAARAQQAGDVGRVRRAAVERDLHRLSDQRAAARDLLAVCAAARDASLVQRIEVADQRARRARQGLLAARARLDEALAELDRSAGGASTTEVFAGVLSARLVPGDACAVCGSTEHPSPAAHRSEAELFASAAARARALAVLEGREESVRHAEAELPELERDLDALRAQAPSVVGDLAAALDREAAAVEAFDRAERRARHALSGLDRALDDARALLASAEARSLAAREERERLVTEHEEAAGRATALWEDLSLALGTLTLFDLPRRLAEIAGRDREREDLEPRLQRVEIELAAAQREWEARRESIASRQSDLERVKVEHEAADGRRQELLAVLRAACPVGEPVAVLAEVDAELERLQGAVARSEVELESARVELLARTASASATAAVSAAASERVSRSERLLEQDLGGEDPRGLQARAMEGADLDALGAQVRSWSERHVALASRVDALERNNVPEVDLVELTRRDAAAASTELARQHAEHFLARGRERLDAMMQRSARVAALEVEHRDLSVQAARLGTLGRLLRADRFVEYVANDHLRDLVRAATQHLNSLTRGRYALDLDEDGGFLVADLDAGGALRPASSLSGGETFLTSLALALALSAQVQRHSRSSLDFFFLDEGFGSLDPEALNRVMTAIEGLGDGRRVIGLISHVGAVRERVPRHLELSCPRDGGGTRVSVREA